MLLPQPRVGSFHGLKHTGKRSQSTLLVGLLSLAFPPALGLLWGPRVQSAQVPESTTRLPFALPLP